MALTTDPYSCIQPFWHIDCPVCGGDDFTELGAGGGVWCDGCGAEFKVRGTSGDPGCVVDAKFDHVYNTLKHDGTKHAWRKALDEMGYYTEGWPDGKTPRVYCYRIMKEPGPSGTYCTDDRGWILAAQGPARPAIEGEDGRPLWKHLTGPLVSREAALEWGKQID